MRKQLPTSDTNKEKNNTKEKNDKIQPIIPKKKEIRMLFEFKWNIFLQPLHASSLFLVIWL